MTRYQGVVALEGEGLEGAAHHYFERSEQIPTLVRLAVGETVAPEGRAWRAGGLIVAVSAGARARGAGPTSIRATRRRGREPHTVDEDDAWTEARRSRRRPRRTS